VLFYLLKLKWLLFVRIDFSCRILCIVLFANLLICCAIKPVSPMEKNKTPDLKSGENKVIITAPVTEKKFVKKNGQVTDIGEFYIQRSIQDYYIKFCESKVTKEELLEALNSKRQTGGFKMEVEFRKGLWDVCDGNADQQSRVGDYVLIHQIFKE
jgi:hypothetical protein